MDSHRHDLAVVLWLMVFGVLALVRHHLMEKKAQEVWLKRLEFEEVVKSSQNDLRVIVEKIQATQARRLAEEKFRMAFLKGPYAMSIQRSSDGTYIEVNPAFERLFGLDRDDVVGQSRLSQSPLSQSQLRLWPDPSEEERLRESAARRALEERRVVLRHASGEDRIVLVSAGPSRFEEQRVILSISRDITEQVKADEALMPRAGLLFQAPRAIFAVDEADCIRYWNQQARATLEWRAVEVIGRRVEEKLTPLWTAPSGEPVARAAWEEIDRHGFWRGDATWRKRSGREISLSGWGFRVEGNGESYRLMVLDL